MEKHPEAEVGTSKGRSREFEAAAPFGITLADGLRGNSDGGNEKGIVRKNKKTVDSNASTVYDRLYEIRRFDVLQ